MSDILSIAQTLDNVEKTFSAPNTNQLAGANMTLMRENLSEVITRLPQKETNIRDRLQRKKGAGLAASWNVLSSFGVGNAPFAEGGTPQEDATSYVRRTAIYKELGKTKSITDKMIAAGRSFTDIEAELTEVAMREIIQDEEQLIITGNETNNPLEFDGLHSYIATHVVDDANSPLGFRTALLDDGIATLLNAHAVRPTAIYCSYGMKKAINQSLAGDVRVNLNMGNEVAVGVDVSFYQSMIGKLPIIPTFAITNNALTVSGQQYTVSDIYIVTEKWQGQDVLFMEDLYPLGKSYLDRTGAAIKFMVTECTVLVCRAQEYQYLIKNVRIA